jgi:hypothetical protein
MFGLVTASHIASPSAASSLASSLPRAGPTSPSYSSSATASGLPDNVPATTGGDSDGDLPVPVQKASAHARVFDDAGSACVLRSPLNTSPTPSPVALRDSSADQIDTRDRRARHRIPPQAPAPHLSIAVDKAYVAISEATVGGPENVDQDQECFGRNHRPWHRFHDPVETTEVAPVV